MVFAATSAYCDCVWPFRRSSTDLFANQREQLERARGPVGAEDSGSTNAACSVVLERARSKKIPVIRVIRAETALGLRESKQLADRGGVVAYGLSGEEADRLVTLLTDAGAQARRLDAARA